MEQDEIYILLSIKTRIETELATEQQLAIQDIYILLSIKTRIETWILMKLHQIHPNLYPTIH